MRLNMAIFFLLGVHPDALKIAAALRLYSHGRNSAMPRECLKFSERVGYPLQTIRPVLGEFEVYFTVETREADCFISTYL